MALNLSKLSAAAAAAGMDQTKVQASGGPREVIPAGKCMVRFIGYVELGQKSSEYQGKPKLKNEVQLTFEVHGKKYPVREFEGKRYPVIITVTESLTQSDKGNWLPLFKALNVGGTAVNAVDLLGSAYLAEIYHKKYAKRGENKSDANTWTGVDVGFRDPNSKAYSFVAPALEDPVEGTITPVNVPEAITPIKGFLWNAPDMEQWDSIYVEGEWAEKKDDKTGAVIFPAKSKNVTQLRIRAAVNYGGSPINYLLANAGKELDLVALDGEDDGDGSDSQADTPANAAAALSGVSAPAVAKPAGRVARPSMSEYDDDIPF